MSDNVVAFQPNSQDRIVRVCRCGCMSFEVSIEGTIRCAACDVVHDDVHVAPMAEQSEVVENTAGVDGNTMTVTRMDTSKAALQRMSNEAINDCDNVTFVLVARDSGKTTWWARTDLVDSPERIEWVRSRVEVMIEAEQNILEAMGDGDGEGN